MAVVAYDKYTLEKAIERSANSAMASFTKGLPPDFQSGLNAIAERGYNLLAGDLPLPVAILRQSAVNSNRAWMREFLKRSNAFISPHGKTPMAPALAAMQMEDGAWAITAATVQQAVIFAHFGIRRIFIANQVAGNQNIKILLDLIAGRTELDIFCLVDSIAGADMLFQAVVGRNNPGLSIQVLIEVGGKGGRAGVRNVKQGLDLARHLASLSPALRLRGIEAYEGVFGHHALAQRDLLARKMIADVAKLAKRCEAEGYFAGGQVILSAGGTEYFDIAAEILSDAELQSAPLVLVRSGCYLTHDHLSFERMFQRLLQRSKAYADISPRLTPALEVWAAVQSQPEPGLALCTMGKRDVSYDVEMPVPVWWFRPGKHKRPVSIPPGVKTKKLNDQHAYLSVPKPSPFEVGDMIGFGVSHVCTTFDKWRCVHLVNDSYDVVQSVQTFF